MPTTTTARPTRCDACGKTLPAPPITGGSGYAHHPGLGYLCYPCCGRLDAQRVRDAKPGARETLYLEGGRLQNWPGTFTMRVVATRETPHNMASKMTHVWAVDCRGRQWYGRGSLDWKTCLTLTLLQKGR